MFGARKRPRPLLSESSGLGCGVLAGRYFVLMRSKRSEDLTLLGLRHFYEIKSAPKLSRDLDNHSHSAHAAVHAGHDSNAECRMQNSE